MASKDSEKKQWTDPKDYGLPWVEIKPLKIKEEEISLPADQTIEPVSEPISQSKVAESNPQENSKIDIPEVAKLKEQDSKKVKTNEPKIEKEKSQSWIWIVVILALVLVGVIVWQMLGNKSEVSAKETTSAISEPKVESPPVEAPISLESTSTDSIQPSENQEEKEISQEQSPNISKSTDSGTTIANKVNGPLIRIEAQEQRPQYFIVVGSLPNEADALKQAPIYQAKAAEVYLISPYSESKNYRLAIGKYGSFKQAAEALDQIKSQYTEALWILKY